MYLKYFGLREAPFNLTPDPKFYFNSPLHREALAALYYGIQSKKGFIVVTGEVGTGKTTLLRKLLRSLDATHHSVFIFNTLLTFEELLAYTVRDLGLEPNGGGRAALIQQLNEYLLDNIKRGHTVSILIDEAQQLSEEALEAIRFLSNLETDREKLVQIILVGQPELEAKLNRPSLRQLKQRVSLWSRLDRLDAKDTEAYIRHRLELVGYQGPNIFDRGSMKLIFEHSCGIPRLINSICDNALLTAFALSQKLVSERIVQEVVRDLRLIPTGELVETTVVEHEKGEQVESPGAAKVTEFGKDRFTREEQRQDQLAKGSIVSPPGPPNDDEVFHNLGLRQGPGAGHQMVLETELRRAPDRNPFLAEKKQKKSEQRARVIAPAETSRLYVASGRNSDASHYRKPSPRAAEFVSAPFFAKMIDALTNAMGPMASVVFRDQIAKLGESREQFPVSRIPELVQAINREILSDSLRRRFEEDVDLYIRELSSTATSRPTR